MASSSSFSMTQSNSNNKLPSIETISGLCKRRGFIFQTSEIYGGYNGFFDYGPLGVELKRNIKDAWWRDMVQHREDVIGLDSAIITHPRVWEASGHIDGFSDPLVDCKVSKMRYRADQLFYGKVVVDGETIGYVATVESLTMDSDAEEQANKLKRKLGKQGELAKIELKEYTEALPEEHALIPSPATGEPGSLTPPRAFNLMFETKVGAMSDASSTAYLRPETAQGIFQNYKNVLDTGRVKLPFGIAQVGKAFRNEITPRNFIFRSREFEQMEIEYFIPPDEDLWQAEHQKWIDTCKNWLLSIGLPETMIGEHVHPKEKLAHYSRACTDLTFRFPFGQEELWGIAARGNFDLTQHQKFSNKNLDYFDPDRKEKYVPHVIEPSLGVDRTFLALLTAAYAEDEVDGEKRVVLRFHPRIAPIKAAVFPLVKNKPPLVEKARSVFRTLQRRYNVFWDASGAIGRRYRRQDEIGTPFGITVDFDTLEDDSVTLRDRDTTEQKRIPIADLLTYLQESIEA